MLRFMDSQLIAMYGMIPFSTLEWGAGLEPEHDWQDLMPTAAGGREAEKKAQRSRSLGFEF